MRSKHNPFETMKLTPKRTKGCHGNTLYNFRKDEEVVAVVSYLDRVLHVAPEKEVEHVDAIIRLAFPSFPIEYHKTVDF